MKRVFDIIFAGTLLVVLAPLLAAIAFSGWWCLGRPILFTQWRPGKDGQPFLLLKFRTMRDARQADGTPLPDGDRLTPFGRLLRSTSLDELPELWNVLKGDMSMVGPRPLLLEYLPLYSDEQARRHEIRPGLTGWAQVKGRNALSWEEKFAHDVWYVDNRSFWLDLKILALTVIEVLRRTGISAKDQPTMPPFKGERGSVDDHS